MLAIKEMWSLNSRIRTGALSATQVHLRDTWRI